MLPIWVHPPSDPKSLAEEEAKPLALEWLASATAALERLAAARSSTAGHEIVLAALRVNLAWDSVPASDRARLLRRILGNTSRRPVINRPR